MEKSRVAGDAVERSIAVAVGDDVARRRDVLWCEGSGSFGWLWGFDCCCCDIFECEQEREINYVD